MAVLLKERQGTGKPWLIRRAPDLSARPRGGLGARQVVVAAAAASCGDRLFHFPRSEFVPRLSEGTKQSTSSGSPAPLSRTGSRNRRADRENPARGFPPMRWDPDQDRHGRTRHRPDGARALRCLHDAHPSQSNKARGRQRELIDPMDRESSRSSRHKPHLHSADRDACQRDDRRMAMSVSRFSATTSRFWNRRSFLIAPSWEPAGSADVSVEQLTGQPKPSSLADRRRLSRYGIPPREALTFIEGFGGVDLGEVHEGHGRIRFSSG